LVRGWNEFLSSKPNKNDKSPLQKKKLFSNEDRIFTLSSSTAKTIDFESGGQKKKNRPKDIEEDLQLSPQKKKFKKS